jgi:hypothetical protein
LRGLALREQLFGGALLTEGAHESIVRLRVRAHAAVAQAFALANSEPLPQRASNPDWLSKLSEARGLFARDSEVRRLVFAYAESLHFSVDRCVIDRPRIRANQPGLAQIAAAAPALYAHRDTWYGNPQAQINVWTALEQAPRDTGFAIFSDVFHVAVDNDSEQFSYDEFRADVGWQRPSPPPTARYPRALREEQWRDRSVLIAPEIAEVVLFSAAHLHQTLAHSIEHIRWSIDFRVVCLDDVSAGRGAPNCDNCSRGDASVEYWRC